MVQLLFKFSWSKLDEIFTKSVSGCNQQHNIFKNSPKKKPNAVKLRGRGSGVGMTAVKDSMFFFYPLPYYFCRKMHKKTTSESKTGTNTRTKSKNIAEPDRECAENISEFWKRTKNRQIILISSRTGLRTAENLNQF